MDLIIYRGPLERARLSFIFEVIEEVFENLHFIWICPTELNPERKKFSEDFIDEYNFAKVEIIEHNYRSFFFTRKRIKKFIGKERVGKVCLIGFTALEFGLNLKAQKKLWFINGVPEEKLFVNKNFLNRGLVVGMWLMKRPFIKDIDLVVTVSNKMSDLVKSHLNVSKIFAAPTCVDRNIFLNNKSDRKIDFCYMGSGAVWQAMDLLSQVWNDLYRLNPKFRFRVISRDSRTHFLGKNIPANNIEFVESNDFKKVADFLSDCKFGFLLRKDDIVNRVCFPTKIGEYLASGCGIISTNIDWDVKDYFRNYKIGLLVSPDKTSLDIAKEILKFYKIQNSVSKDEIEQASVILDRKYWKQKLIDAIEK